ncbi:GalNAc(5)-diNAcBac-PP-undecaprenol beta-1,3-glucosyltransferase [Lactobacillus helveticus]|uniref:glycosyltransferase family 2 protein n=1 Tax=Lactobacillus helveticus TaxID=1587 RepID=UPI00156211AE|nr:glycosyltransferase family 2 protein [Lactobacillus helveticus]NRN79252.1 GalNAc(5)-diNAcBac-PP-undecaprenol beta-1,3-glucosyltransferase [Lactobacillus helveticus]NRO41308.1 GalNAc(5)-diNAcBac-PP-undecaprenol beta-1,3-glucosyltransferase [Lactobacillus helveticus]
MNNKVAAIVVTYNRKKLLKKNIRALLAQTYKNFLDILVIDNASTDFTKEAIQQYINNKDIIYINTGKNLGGAGGFNFGMRKAAELNYKFMWIMDDDTIPTPTALEELIKEDKKLNGNYGFLSSKVLWKDNSVCKMNIQKRTKWRRIHNFETTQNIQYASFVSFFIPTKVVKKMGLPYKEFFIWSDDWEYSRRISKKYTCRYVPDSIVKHWCNSNVGADIVDAPANRINRFSYLFRNDVVLYRLDGLEGSFYLNLRTIKYIIKILLKGNNKKQKLHIMFSALKKGKNFYPVIEYIN